jgi:hypothetical protein
MNKVKITAWVTKYALSKTGIEEVEGEVCHGTSSDMLRYGQHGCVHGNDWHSTREDAVKRAEQMRLNKIASLKKQLEKLEKMRFE